MKRLFCLLLTALLLCAAAPAVGEGGAGRPPTTPYVAVGDWPLGITFALLIAAMILVKYSRYGKLRSMSV